MQRDYDSDLISAWKSGDLPAAHAFVRARQAEVLSIAYLLTIHRDQARGLARATFVKFFRDARSLDPDADHRVLLLMRLGRCFLRKEFEAEPEPQSGFLPDAVPQKYGVENQRDRTLAALGRLDERDRVALVLGEVAGLQPGDLNQVLERGSSALAAPVETARQRLRHSLDLAQGAPVRPALLDAGFDGPRDNLWLQLEADVEEIQSRNQRHGQLVTWGVAGGVLLVILIGTIALFGADLIDGSGDDLSSSVEATIAASSDDDGVFAEPTLVPASPTPTLEPLPAGNVPELLLTRSGGEDGSVASQNFMLYDPESSTLQIAGGTEQDPLPVGETPVYLSPDGELLVLAHMEMDPQGQVTRHTAIAIDTATLAERWQVELGATTHDPVRGYTNRLGLVLTSERMYVSTLDGEGSGSVRITGYDLVDGASREELTIELDALDTESAAPENLLLYLAPDESSLFVVLHTSNWRTNRIEDARVLQLTLPDLEVASTVVEATEDGAVPFQGWGAPLAVDGRTLYHLSYAQWNWPALVEFFDLESGTRATLELPFTNEQALPFPQIATVLSHNGQRLYQIDAVTGDTVIVNLLERRIEKQFSIDAGSFSALFGRGPDQLTFSAIATLSLDGTRLYVASGHDQFRPQGETPGQSGIWVIDLNEWKIVQFVPVEGLVTGILGGFQDQSLLVRVAGYQPGDSAGASTLLRVSITNENALIQPLGGGELPDEQADMWAFSLFDIYRQQHGRSPAVAGTVPADLDSYSTLPRIEAFAPRNVVRDISTTIEVRVIDPVSGEILRSQRDDVRFDPDSTMTALLTAEGQPGQLVILGQVENGVYRGSANLPAEGTWAVDVSVIAPDGSTSLVSEAGMVVVAPTLLGSDGNRYQFRLRFDPSWPVAGHEASFRLRLVEVESGAVVSPDVHFDVEQPVLDGARIGELPNRISISLANPATYFGTRTILAGQVSPGVWEGRITFQESGAWTTSVRLHFAGSPVAEIPTGRFEVLRAP